VPAIKRALTPAAWRQRTLVRAARATFVERGVHNTRDRTGILVYISQLERAVTLVFDSGLERKLSADARAEADRKLTAASRAAVPRSPRRSPSCRHRSPRSHRTATMTSTSCPTRSTSRSRC